VTGLSADSDALRRFSARLDPASPRPLAVAFSGGSDSLALLTFACDYGRATGRRIVALTVDHGLNAASAGWTAAAGETARRLGAEWRSLVWEGTKPLSGLPAAARQARHTLLADAARSLGARVILMGHTADDLAESALMRAQDTPALPDPREWSPSPVWPAGRRVFLFRPLLGTGRQGLRERLTALGLTWIEDPANLDPRFARARARRILGEATTALAHPAPAPSPDTAVLAPTAARLTLAVEGHATFPRRLADETPASQFVPVLGAAVVSIGGALAPPRRQVLDRLAARLCGTTPLRAQLAGVRVQADAAEVLLARDAGDGRRRAAALADDLFDQRFETPPGIPVGFLAGRASRLSAADRMRLRRIPALARGSLPVLDPDGAHPRLPHPIGAEGDAVTALAPARFAAACGLVAREADIG